MIFNPSSKRHGPPTVRHAAQALLVAAAMMASPAGATEPKHPPKLLVVISVDQLGADLFDEYRAQFHGGFARLSTGTVFRNGYQSHAATETCPGHSTMLTGSHPSRTGIIANVWIDQSVSRKDSAIYCAEDESVEGSSSTSFTVSPVHLMVPTLGELMKARWPQSRSVAVSGKDRAAVMMSGHQVDERWYWTKNKFTTDIKGAAVPAALGKANEATAKALSEVRPPMASPAFCQAKASPIKIDGSDKIVGAGAFARKADDATVFRASPEVDRMTLDLASGLIDEMQLGKGAAPDLLALSLSATDYVGHTYGTQGQEMCIQLMEIDKMLGEFLAGLDARGIDYAVALTADHGMLDTPERLRQHGVPGALRAGPNLSAGAKGAKLAAELGLNGPGLLGEGTQGDVYVDRALAQADRKRMLEAALAAYRAEPLVEAVFTADEIAATPVPTGAPNRWTLLQRVRASYYLGRSGDFIVVLKKDIMPLYEPAKYIGTHGSPWDYDRRVPIIFWRPGQRGAAIATATDAVDIMPTLAAMIGLELVSGSVDGHCLVHLAACPPVARDAVRGAQRHMESGLWVSCRTIVL